MTKNIPLRKLYDAVVTAFPQYDHKPKIFLRDILEVLKKDPIRTSSLQKSISHEGLEFQLNINFPLNEILRGAYEYLEHLGVSQEGAGKFTRKYSEKGLLFD